MEFRTSTTSTAFNGPMSVHKKTEVERIVGSSCSCRCEGTADASRDSARLRVCKDVICLISEVFGAHLAPLLAGVMLDRCYIAFKTFFNGIFVSCANFDNIVP